MRTAVCLIRDREPYSHNQFTEGLRNAGFKVTDSQCHKPSPGDVLLIWNRSGFRHHNALRFEQAGCPVIVAENGWIGSTNEGGKFYALCRNHHNGAGTWPVGSAERLSGMNIELKPWRETGDHILVLASRGIGAPGVAMPRDWPRQTVKALQRRTRRPVRLREHPGDSHASIGKDIRNAHAVVTWASGAAIKAIAAGVPAYYEMKNWIGAPAARHITEDLEAPFLGDRLPMFQRLAWAQWSAQEISTGEPIRRLLNAS